MVFDSAFMKIIFAEYLAFSEPIRFLGVYDMVQASLDYTYATVLASFYVNWIQARTILEEGFSVEENASTRFHAGKHLVHFSTDD